MVRAALFSIDLDSVRRGELSQVVASCCTLGTFPPGGRGSSRTGYTGHCAVSTEEGLEAAL